MKFLRKILPIGLLFSGSLYGQQADATKLITECFNTLKQQKAYSFNYIISCKYPNGKSDKTEGKVYVNESQQVMLNDCPEQTILYTGKWFLKIDHTAKEIGIISMDALGKDAKKSMQTSIFNSSTMSKFIDSFVLKTMIIKKINWQHDTVLADIAFSGNNAVKNIKITFDNTRKELINYTMTTFEPWLTKEYGPNKGTTQTITYSKTNSPDSKMYDIEQYIAYTKKHVVLKKYIGYKLETKL